MRGLVLLAALLVAGCGSEPASPEAPGGPGPETTEAPAEPGLAPDFTLTALDGEPFTLSDHRGEVVVLNFWATWCLPCLAEMPELEAIQQELGGEGVQVVGISQDTGGAEEIRPFAERLGVTYPLLPDPAFQVSTRYGGVSLLPMTLFIGRDGTIAREEAGALTGAELRTIVEDLL